jgi:hypothetical protein
MGLFDRLLGGNNAGAGNTKPAKPAKNEEAFFLDADASSSMGDVNFMRRSNTIRRTFPGTADNPGGKERIEEVASMESRLERATPGLGGEQKKEVDINLTGGVPKPVKKTFCEPMSKAELEQRKKGSAVAVNTPGAAATKKDADSDAQPQISSQQQAKPGDISSFKGWVKDL